MKPSLKKVFDQLGQLIDKEVGRSIGLGGDKKLEAETDGSKSIDGMESCAASSGDNEQGAGLDNDDVKANMPGAPVEFITSGEEADEEPMDEEKKRRLVAMLKGA